VVVARRSVRLTDAQWAKIAPHLPRNAQSPKGGRPRVGNREVVEGILWVLRTGARWRDLPDGYPSGSTCWRRLRDWEAEGIWLELWRAFLRQLDVRGRLQWEQAFIDATFAPAKKGALSSAIPDGARAQSAWWWSTARVYLSEFALPLRPRGKRRSLKRR
jgi:transposase